MKKSLLLVVSALCGTTFAQDTGTVDPAMLQNMMEGGGFMATGIGSLVLILGSILSYVLMSYGLMLLARKYEPTLHPALSWIPLVNLYVALKISGQSPLWLLAILASFIPVIGGLFILGVTIFIYYHIAKRAGMGGGTVAGLILIPVVFFPWLGRTVMQKNTGMVIALGVLASLIALIGGIMMLVGVASMAMSAAESPEFQDALRQAQAQIQNNAGAAQ